MNIKEEIEQLHSEIQIRRIKIETLYRSCEHNLEESKFGGTRVGTNTLRYALTCSKCGFNGWIDKDERKN